MNLLVSFFPQLFEINILIIDGTGRNHKSCDTAGSDRQCQP